MFGSPAIEEEEIAEVVDGYARGGLEQALKLEYSNKILEIT